MLKEKKDLNGFEDDIYIEHRALSRNKIDKMHWAQKSRLKAQYRLLIRNQMRLCKIKTTEEKCGIKIHCYVKRLMDVDNVWGGLKQFIDALCDEGYIYDDSPIWLDIKEVRQIKSTIPKIRVVRKIYN